MGISHDDYGTLAYYERKMKEAEFIYDAVRTHVSEAVTKEGFEPTQANLELLVDVLDYTRISVKSATEKYKEVKAKEAAENDGDGSEASASEGVNE